MLKKTETALIALFALALVAMAVYHFFPHQHVITPDSGWEISTSDDRDSGGNSSATVLPTKSNYVVEFDIQPGIPNPYALMTLTPSTGELIDYSWMESVSLIGRIEGSDSAMFRLHLRNQDHPSELKDADGNSNNRYNEVCFRLTNQSQTITLNREQFYVPGWWIEKNENLVENSTPSFDATAWVEFSTANIASTGKTKLILEEVRLTGHMVPPTVFYSTSLGILLTLGTLIASTEIIQLRRRLTQSKTMELTLQKQATQLNQLAIIDPLTKLLNRRGMRDHVSIAMEGLRLRNEPLSLILFDVDNFKQLNDEHNHAYGDEILRAIAEITTDSLTARQPAARWGGEEFMVVCQGSTCYEAADTAELLRKRIEEVTGVTCSFGVSPVERDGQFSDALNLADSCLYRAKEAGRNRVEIATSPYRKTPPLLTNQPSEEPSQSDDDNDDAPNE